MAPVIRPSMHGTPMMVKAATVINNRIVNTDAWSEFYLPKHDCYYMLYFIAYIRSDRPEQTV